MVLIEFTFPAGRYHATAWGRHVNEGVPEWPPSPYRLTRALYDAWKRKFPAWDSDRVERILAALSSSPPCYRLPPSSFAHTRSYLSKNEENPQGKTLIFDGFVVLNPRSSVLMGWPDLERDESFLDDLDTLLSVLNYLGRSESWVAAKVVQGIEKVEWNCRPVQSQLCSGDLVPVAIAVPPQEYASFFLGKGKKAQKLSWFEAIATGTDLLLNHGLSQPPAMRYVEYVMQARFPESAINAPAVQPGTSFHSVLYSLDGKLLPPVAQTLEIAEQVRTRLMGIHKRLAGGDAFVSPLFSGKNASGSPLTGHRHCFFLPQDRNGDGRIDHVLVYSRHQPFSHREQLALDDLKTLYPHRKKIEIRCVPIHWGEVQSVGSAFVSATPFVLTRHFKPKQATFDDWLHTEIARECANHGIESPVAIEGIPNLDLKVGRSIRWAEFRRNRKEDPIRTGLGLRLTFSQPVRGPLALGYGCHFGLGQFRKEIT